MPVGPSRRHASAPPTLRASEPRYACNACRHVDALVSRRVARVGRLFVELVELGAQLGLPRDLALLRLLEGAALLRLLLEVVDLPQSLLQLLALLLQLRLWVDLQSGTQ